MIVFCPTCANMLLVEFDNNQLRYFCQTCPYVYNIDKPITKRIALKRKEKDDILGSSDTWQNCAKADTSCPKCFHTKAYNFEMQTRSADEPTTQFYKCIECEHTWREN